MSFISTYKSKRLIFPLFLLAFSLLYLINSIFLGAPLENGRLTPSFFPLLLGVISTVFTLILLARTTKQKSDVEKSASAQEKVGTRKIEKYLPLLVISSTVIYIIIFPIIGYFLSSLLYVLSIIIIFSDLKKTFIKFILAIAVVLLGYLLFEQVFRVRLPALGG